MIRYVKGLAAPYKPTAPSSQSKLLARQRRLDRLYRQRVRHLEAKYKRARRPMRSTNAPSQGGTAIDPFDAPHWHRLQDRIERSTSRNCETCEPANSAGVRTPVQRAGRVDRRSRTTSHSHEQRICGFIQQLQLWGPNLNTKTDSTVIWDSGATACISNDRAHFVGNFSADTKDLKLEGIGSNLAIEGAGHVS